MPACYKPVPDNKDHSHGVLRVVDGLAVTFGGGKICGDVTGMPFKYPLHIVVMPVLILIGMSISIDNAMKLGVIGDRVLQLTGGGGGSSPTNSSQLPDAPIAPVASNCSGIAPPSSCVVETEDDPDRMKTVLSLLFIFAGVLALVSAFIALVNAIYLWRVFFGVQTLDTGLPCENPEIASGKITGAVVEGYAASLASRARGVSRELQHQAGAVAGATSSTVSSAAHELKHQAGAVAGATSSTVSSAAHAVGNSPQGTKVANGASRLLAATKIPFERLPRVATDGLWSPKRFKLPSSPHLHKAKEAIDGASVMATEGMDKAKDAGQDGVNVLASGASVAVAAAMPHMKTGTFAVAGLSMHHSMSATNRVVVEAYRCIPIFCSCCSCIFTLVIVLISGLLFGIAVGADAFCDGTLNFVASPSGITTLSFVDSTAYSDSVGAAFVSFSNSTVNNPVLSPSSANTFDDIADVGSASTVGSASGAASGAASFGRFLQSVEDFQMHQRQPRRLSESVLFDTAASDITRLLDPSLIETLAAQQALGNVSGKLSSLLQRGGDAITPGLETLFQALSSLCTSIESLKTAQRVCNIIKFVVTEPFEAAGADTDNIVFIQQVTNVCDTVVGSYNDIVNRCPWVHEGLRATQNTMEALNVLRGSSRRRILSEIPLSTSTFTASALLTALDESNVTVPGIPDLSAYAANMSLPDVITLLDANNITIPAVPGVPGWVSNMSVTDLLTVLDATNITIPGIPDLSAYTANMSLPDVLTLLDTNNVALPSVPVIPTDVSVTDLLALLDATNITIPGIPDLSAYTANMSLPDVLSLLGQNNISVPTMSGLFSPSVSTTFTASGDVSDYSDSVMASVQSTFASASSVAPSAVTIDVVSASVSITVTITVDSAAIATSLSSSLRSGVMASPANLEAALASNGVPFTVAAITSAPSVSIPSLPGVLSIPGLPSFPGLPGGEAGEGLPQVDPSDPAAVLAQAQTLIANQLPNLILYARPVLQSFGPIFRMIRDTLRRNLQRLTRTVLFIQGKISLSQYRAELDTAAAAAVAQAVSIGGAVASAGANASQGLDLPMDPETPSLPAEPETPSVAEAAALSQDGGARRLSETSDEVAAMLLGQSSTASDLRAICDEVKDIEDMIVGTFTGAFLMLLGVAMISIITQNQSMSIRILSQMDMLHTHRGEDPSSSPKSSAKSSPAATDKLLAQMSSCSAEEEAAPSPAKRGLGSAMEAAADMEPSVEGTPAEAGACTPPMPEEEGQEATAPAEEARPDAPPRGASRV